MNRFLQILLALLCSGAIYAQKISFDTSHGLPGTITSNNYVWKSPEISLGKAVNGIRITFLETEGGDSHNGFPIVALGELEVYNSNNNKITFSKVSTNSLETSEGSIEALNDGKYSTFYHSKWNKGTSPNDYVYLDITFNTSIENFSIKQVSRETKRLMGTYICITPVGVAWNEVSDVVGGTTTDGLNWSFNTLTNELKISGTGPMHDYLGNDMDSRQWLRYIKIIKKITINDGVTSVGANAFYHCSELESVNLPNSIKIIGEGAFYYCNSLENINIPKTVTRIDDRAFYHCKSLTNFTLPQSLQILGYNVFLDTPYYDGSNNGLLYKDNWIVGYKGDMPNDSKITIKDGCVGVSYGIFMNAALSELNIPSTFRYFGTFPFWNCECQLVNINCNIEENCDFSGNGFKEIIFGNKVKYIKSDVGGLSLKKVTIGSNIEIIGKEAFSDSRELESIKMSNSVKIIGDFAFENCKSLKSIELPQGLDSIGSSAFLDCTALEKLTIPSSVTKLGVGIVQGNTCPLYINCDIPNNVYFTCKSPKITIGENVQFIGDFAFYNSTEFEEIVIPNSVEYIGDYAFAGCTSLKNIKLSDNLLTLGKCIFVGCPLTELVLPKSLKNIAIDAFVNISPETVYINCNLPDRESYTSATFWACNVTKFVIGENVTDIGDYSFYYCTKISNINLPNSVKRLGAKAFSYCENLKDISISSGIEQIGENAFEGCNKIEKVTIADVDKWCLIDFKNQLSNPASLAKELYANGDLLTTLEINDGVSIIKPYAFYNCKNISDVNIPASVSEICDYSFEGCRALKNLYIDCTTPPILGNNAFFNTTVENRGTLYVPAGTKTLYSEADCWQYFRNIVERGGTNINTTECKYNIKFSGDYLKFDGLPQNTIIEIYSLQGKLLNKFISNGDSNVFVEDDLVIVKIGNKTMKIAKQSSI